MLGMKWFLKGMLKLTMVVIIPIVVCYICFTKIFLVFTHGWEVLALGTLALVTSLLNALMYTVFMDKTNMFPKVLFNVVPMIGLAIGWDNTGYDSKYGRIIILLPFVTIEFIPRGK